ncbi:MAG: hypothetical protein KKG75_04535 [Nanoarchaeota archaeon]|nr:hypothetical protein [Nanoarchaeota archaeon]
MKVILDNTIKLYVEAILFLLVVIIIFNELTQLLETLELFTQESIKLTGIISILLATDNMLSNRFLGLKIFS